MRKYGSYNISYEPKNSVILFPEQSTPLKLFEEHLFRLEVETKLKIHSKIKPPLLGEVFNPLLPDFKS